MNDASATLREVFSRALDCATLSERDRYLSAACAGNTALRAEVEALLRAHADAGSFLGRPEANRAASCEDTAAGPAADEEETSLDFLASSQKAGSLGRLDHYEV